VLIKDVVFPQICSDHQLSALLPFPPTPSQKVASAEMDNRYDNEKTIEVGHFERTISEDSIVSQNQAAIDALTPEEQKKLIWRIDVRLVLTLGFMYCVSLMDRYATYPATLHH
jgi:hypothetical protein